MNGQRATSWPAGRRWRSVAIGGGHGLSRTLQALAACSDEVTAVVTVADDGGSSGRLRRDLGVLPPGDLRMALAALASDDERAELLQYRFDRGDLDGHSLGNLVLVALADLRGGDLVAALDVVGGWLGVRGRVVPCTTVPITLHARTSDGAIAGQVAVAEHPRVEQVWVEPETPPATPEAVGAIGEADLIVLGPGSLYTSILPNLLVPDVARAVRSAAAPVVLVANLREQPGETEGMTLEDHLQALDEHVPGLHLDVIVVHDGPPPAGPGSPLRGEALARALPDGTAVVRADLLDGDDGHDPRALCGVFEQLRREHVVT